jgi:hypothetical protein
MQIDQGAKYKAFQVEKGVYQLYAIEEDKTVMRISGKKRGELVGIKVTDEKEYKRVIDEPKEVSKEEINKIMHKYATLPGKESSKKQNPSSSKE